MRYFVILSVLALLLSACGVQPNSPAVKTVAIPTASELIPGTWTANQESPLATNKSTIIFAKDGGMVTRLTIIRTNETLNVIYEGYWQYADGFLLTTITNTSNQDTRAIIGRTNQLKIVHVGDHNLVFETKTGQTRLMR